jgi:hypothetical protein
MVEALVCNQDWLKRVTPISIVEDTEALTKLEVGDSISHLFSLLLKSVNQLFIHDCILFISELTEELKEKVVVDNNACKSQVQGSKATSTSKSKSNKGKTTQSQQTRTAKRSKKPTK